MCIPKVQCVCPVRWRLLSTMTVVGQLWEVRDSLAFTRSRATFVNKLIKRVSNTLNTEGTNVQHRPSWSLFITITSHFAHSRFLLHLVDASLSILHVSVWLPVRPVSLLSSPLAALGFSHPASTMKHFALCAIGSSVRGRHPRGHINSAVRTKPPSRQFPSASIPTTETERGQN